MTSKHVEEQLTDLMHREPFQAFVIEMQDGTVLRIRRPNVAFDDTGGVFIGDDGGLVEFEFHAVDGIRITSNEAAA